MSTNISKQKREDLLAKIKEIRTFISNAPQDENTGNLLSYLSDLEKDVNGKKYGLVFEEHREEIDEVLDTHTPVLTEDRDLFIDNGGQMNFLIEGDNLASLKLLEKTHKGKIDLIYIDPPYNTGNKDFIYDDCYVDKVDSFKHSKWLSFMRKRLYIAKSLLSENGAIFINIDDKEHSQLKLLCDDIFGESNFMTSIPWHNRTSMQNDTDISVNHEYILVYAKYKRQDNRRLKDSNKEIWNNLKGFTFIPKETDKSKFSNPDNDPRGLWKADPFDAPNIRPNLTYPITNPVTGEQYLPPRGRHWRISKEKFADAYANNRIVFGKNGTGRPQMKIFYNEVNYKGSVPDTWFDAHIFSTSTQGKKELLKILPNTKQIFSTPKPIGLYVELLKLTAKSNATILDFFAGSGTTGHAVMKLNAEDGGNRKFILCTNNENNICRDVTYERIKRVIEKEGYTASLKYYKIDYIPISDRMYYEYADELLKHIRELVELENGVNFTDNAEIGIVLTEEELDEFIENTDSFVKCRKLYMGHDVLPTEEQEKKLQAHDIEISIIPDYYYRDLQEG